MARQRPTHIPTPHIDRIVIRDVQYQFEVNRCRPEEVNFQGSSANKGDCGQDGQTADLFRIAAKPIHFAPGFQGSGAKSVKGDSGQGGRTDGQTGGDNHKILTFSPKSVGIMNVNVDG
ncbi:hypothetical protein DPMN_193189 [Dreissena polymorpha]|uniref:Uncharacterized protein n=1 Tax=Dreissena polymorpha TaxID=45954 RepID=A0A9D4BEX3_DREPO|nr:hypothetical protein DPMN_193189 [Dreissena polymorpha]